MTETKKIEWDGKPIPVHLWGKDHWSTLLYIESRCVDHKGKPHADNMRTEPGRIVRGHFRRGADGDEVMRPKPPNTTRYATRLNNGTEIFGHDDWDCASDMEDAGLLEWNGTGMLPVFKLTDIGWQIAGELRRHRAEGKPDAKFKTEVYLGAAQEGFGPQPALATAAAAAGAECTEPEPKVGDVVEIDHTRKGKFTMRITSIDEEWMHGVIVSGKAKAVLSHNEREEGEHIGVRLSFLARPPRRLK